MSKRTRSEGGPGYELSTVFRDDQGGGVADLKRTGIFGATADQSLGGVYLDTRIVGPVHEVVAKDARTRTPLLRVPVHSMSVTAAMHTAAHTPGFMDALRTGQQELREGERIAALREDVRSGPAGNGVQFGPPRRR